MFKIDEIIIHPSSGVCRIVDIRTERFSSAPEKYYVLLPIYATAPTKIFVPVFGEKIKLRYPLSKEEVLSVIEKSSSIDSQWIENDKQRSEFFNEVLSEKDPAKIISIICELHKKRREKALNGKKLRSSDERVLSEAEKYIHQEFAYILDIKPDDVAEFIISRLGLSHLAQNKEQNQI